MNDIHEAAIEAARLSGINDLPHKPARTEASDECGLGAEQEASTAHQNPVSSHLGDVSLTIHTERISVSAPHRLPEQDISAEGGVHGSLDCLRETNPHPPSTLNVPADPAAPSPPSDSPHLTTMIDLAKRSFDKCDISSLTQLLKYVIKYLICLSDLRRPQVQ
jgi:hypothetical protein